MSKKRTSTEPSNDEQMNEDSDAFRQEDNYKRGRFASFSDTTLQDIPIETLQHVLVKAVAMEVQKMKLAKSVWKEKGDQVISRLRTVCSQWSSVLTTDFFRLELHRALDATAPVKIRMEICQETFVNYFALKVDTLHDEILLYCYDQHRDSVTSALTSSISIAVYDRSDLEKVKEEFTVPGLDKGGMAACNVSNCVYVLDINEKLHCASIRRITRDAEHKFTIQTWISDLRLPISYTTSASSGSLSVSDEGNLIVISRPETKSKDPTMVCVYNPIGVLQRKLMLSPRVYRFKSIDRCVIKKSNGNLVFAFANDASPLVITEIGADGFVQRQFESSFRGWSIMNIADTADRILIYDVGNKVELLDVELNLMEFTGPAPDPSAYCSMHSLHFNSEGNELLGVCEAYNPAVGDRGILLSIFRFREE